MATKQRKINDQATADRRERADRAREDDRKKNDDLTIQRRAIEDEHREENRERNDQMTDNRRRENDGGSAWILITIFILILLLVGAYFYLL